MAAALALPEILYHYCSAESFFNELITSLGTNQAGIITTPSADKGSVDALSTLTSQTHKTPILYVTTEEYGHGIRPDQFPSEVDLPKYTATPKYMFPGGDLYSQATARAATGLIVLGGRNDTVREFMNIVKEGKKAVVIVDTSLGDAFDHSKQRANNAGVYLRDQVDSLNKSSLKHPEVAGLTSEFLSQHQADIAKNVKFINIRSEGSNGAARQAAAFLKA